MKETFHCEVLWYFRGLIYGPPRAVAGFDNRTFLAPRVLLQELAVEACDRGQRGAQRDRHRRGQRDTR